MKTTLLYMLAAFVLQGAVFLVVVSYGLPASVPEAIGYILVPGAVLFWSEGIHSSFPQLGLVLALLVNTAYYALIVIGIDRLQRRYRGRRELSK